MGDDSLRTQLKKSKSTFAFSRRKLELVDEFAHTAKDGIYRAVQVVRKRFPKRRKSLAPGAATESLTVRRGLKSKQNQDLFSILRDMWSENCHNLPVNTDVPRLIRRVTMIGRDREILFSAKAENVGKGNIPTATLIVLMVKKLAEILESDEKADSIAQESDRLFEKVTEQMDLQDWMKDLLNAVGTDSKTVKVVKCINQNVVLQGVWKLKVGVTKNFMTRDVKTEDGWQIIITLADYIQVKHARREQSVDLHGDTNNHWEFDWDISMTFDGEMKELSDSRLTITKVR